MARKRWLLITLIAALCLTASGVMAIGEEDTTPTPQPDATAEATALDFYLQGKRYYDQNGNLTRKIFQEVLTGTFSSPVTHVALSFIDKDTHHEDWTVPGLLINVTGQFHVYLPHGGTVIFEAGRTIETLDNFLSESGPHPFADYFVFGDTAALHPLCDALQ